MTKTALMFGSIGSVAETSDIQRRAYNKAMQEGGLSWSWDRDLYANLLEQAGGKERLALLSAATAATGADLTPAQIDQIHARKTEIACAEIAEGGIEPRPGVADLIRLAKDRGMKVAFVTTTYRPNIDAIFAGAGQSLSEADFDHIVTRQDVAEGKPAPDAYLEALKALNVEPSETLAIEDTANSVMSAKRAGIEVVATPGALSAGQDLWQADLVVESLAGDGGVDRRVVEALGLD